MNKEKQKKKQEQKYNIYCTLKEDVMQTPTVNARGQTLDAIDIEIEHDESMHIIRTVSVHIITHSLKSLTQMTRAKTA